MLSIQIGYKSRLAGMKRIRDLATSKLLLFAVLTVVTYGLLIPWLGYYWDDWVFVFLAHAYGPAEFIRAFARNRPLLGIIFFLTTSVLGDNPVLWQIFGLFIRFLLVYATWWTLSQVWPKYRKQVLITSLFFLVYPGYSQQWVAFTHINQELIPLTVYITSIGLTAYAVHNKDRYIRSTVFALALMFVGLFSTEYFVGYEAIMDVRVKTSQHASGKHSGAGYRTWYCWLYTWRGRRTSACQGHTSPMRSRSAQTWAAARSILRLDCLRKAHGHFSRWGSQPGARHSMV
jgi:hypothetical protein